MKYTVPIAINRPRIGTQDLEINIEELYAAGADELLKNQAPNRGRNEKLIRAIISDFLSGLFYFAGDPIRIGRDGKLFDGQHRLHAYKIVVHQFDFPEPCPFLVIRGFDPKVFAAADGGKSRTNVQALSTIYNVGQAIPTCNPAVLAGAASLVYRWLQAKNGQIPLDSQVPATRLHEMAMIQRFPALLSFSAQYGKKGTSKLTPAVAAAAHVILQQRDSVNADEFMSQLVDGIGLQSGDLIRYFRETWLANKMPKTDQARINVLYTVLHTFLRWEQGQIKGNSIRLVKILPRI
jgi:hypothetical protein